MKICRLCMDVEDYCHTCKTYHCMAWGCPEAEACPDFRQSDD